MKVSELIELLKKEDPDLEVIMQEDPEGNGYSPLWKITDGIYEPITKWSGHRVDDGGPGRGTNALFLVPLN